MLSILLTEHEHSRVPNRADIVGELSCGCLSDAIFGAKLILSDCEPDCFLIRNYREPKPALVCKLRRLALQAATTSGSEDMAA